MSIIAALNPARINRDVPQEDLENAREGTPLKVFYLQSKQSLPPFPPYLSWLTEQIKGLWIRTFDRYKGNLETPDLKDRVDFLGKPPTLQQLKVLETEVLEKNLRRIGKLWKQPGCFGGVLISSGSVRNWVVTDRERFQSYLTSADFPSQVADRCTFIPPEVARLIPDDQWIAIGSEALNIKTFHDRSYQEDINLDLLTQIIVERKDQIPDPIVLEWFIRANQVRPLYSQIERKCKSAEYVLSLLVSRMRQNPEKDIQNLFKYWPSKSHYDDSFLVQKSLISLVSHVSAPCLNEITETTFEVYDKALTSFHPLIKQAKNDLWFRLISAYGDRMDPHLLKFFYIYLLSRKTYESESQRKSLLKIFIGRLSKEEVGTVLRSQIGASCLYEIRYVLEHAADIETVELDAAVLFLFESGYKGIDYLTLTEKTSQEVARKVLGELLRKTSRDLEEPPEWFNDPVAVFVVNRRKIRKFRCKLISEILQKPTEIPVEFLKEALTNCILVNFKKAVFMLIPRIHRADPSLIVELLANVLLKKLAFYLNDHFLLSLIRNVNLFEFCSLLRQMPFEGADLFFQRKRVLYILECLEKGSSDPDLNKVLDETYVHFTRMNGPDAPPSPGRRSDKDRSPPHEPLPTFTQIDELGGLLSPPNSYRKGSSPPHSPLPIDHPPRFSLFAGLRP